MAILRRHRGIQLELLIAELNFRLQMRVPLQLYFLMESRDHPSRRTLPSIHFAFLPMCNPLK